MVPRIGPERGANDACSGLLLSDARQGCGSVSVATAHRPSQCPV